MTLILIAHYLLISSENVTMFHLKLKNGKVYHKTSYKSEALLDYV